MCPVALGLSIKLRVQREACRWESELVNSRASSWSFLFAVIECMGDQLIGDAYHANCVLRLEVHWCVVHFRAGQHAGHTGW